MAELVEQVAHPKVKIERRRAGDDPHIDVWTIEVFTEEKGVWRETYGTAGERDAFLRGLSAAYAMQGLYLDAHSFAHVEVA